MYSIYRYVVLCDVGGDAVDVSGLEGEPTTLPNHIQQAPTYTQHTQTGKHRSSGQSRPKPGGQTIGVALTGDSQAGGGCLLAP